MKNSSTLPLSLPSLSHLTHSKSLILFLFLASHLQLVNPVFDLHIT